MSETTSTSRRDFLAATAKVAAVASLASAAGCASADRGPVLASTAGPSPKPIDPNKPLRLGLVGVGGRGNRLLDAMLKQENICIKAVADVADPKTNKRVKGALKKIKEKLGKEPALYNGPMDYRDKLLARDDIDAVVLAVPCHLHTPMYLDCFAAGKHFYGEKPLAITVNETEAMVAAQKKNPQVIGQIGFQRRATERYNKGIQMIRDGAFGDLYDGRGAWLISCGPLGMASKGQPTWFGRRALSGDWMLEQACHTWDVFAWVADKLPLAASGMGRRDLCKDLDPERDVTDFYFAHIEYPGGFMVDFEHNWFCPHNDNKKLFTGVFERVTGPKGSIALEEGKCFWRDKDKEPTNVVEKTGDYFSDTDESIAAFVKTLRTNGKPVSGVENGRLATLTGLLVRKAVDERRWVTIKEITG